MVRKSGGCEALKVGFDSFEKGVGEGWQVGAFQGSLLAPSLDECLRIRSSFHVSFISITEPKMREAS